VYDGKHHANQNECLEEHLDTLLQTDLVLEVDHLVENPSVLSNFVLFEYLYFFKFHLKNVVTTFVDFNLTDSFLEVINLVLISFIEQV
jgi:hypothetical protein